MRPWGGPVPVPPENAFNRPDVPPWAAAENVSSPISMVQEPRPTGIPDSDASYWASSRPCADAGAACDRSAPAHRQKNTHLGEMARRITDWRSWSWPALWRERLLI